MSNLKIQNEQEIRNFVKTNQDYYVKKFEDIGNSSKYVFSFNLAASLLGSVWFGFRNIWNWSLAFLIIETFAIVQIIRGFFGNISAEAYTKIEKIESTIAFRKKQLEAAIENNPDKVEMFERTINSLQKSVDEFLAEAQRIEASGFWIAIGGIILFLGIRIIQGMYANTILEKRFSEWLSNKSIHPGMGIKNFLITGIFSLVIILFSTIHYSFPNLMNIMKDFPTHPDIRLSSIAGVEGIFDYLVLKGERVFDAITYGISRCFCTYPYT